MRIIPMEKLQPKTFETLRKEFKKDFGANCKMCLYPINTSHEAQMVINWIVETDLDHYNHHHKMVRPNLKSTLNEHSFDFMIKMEPSIPVARMQIINTQDDVISLQQTCGENQYIIRPVFNPKLRHNPSLYLNAIRIAYFFSFIQMNAIQVWMEIPSYHKPLIQMVKELGFQQQSQFFGQAFPSTKFKMTVQEFKKIEFFMI